MCKKYGISKFDLENADEENANIAYTRYVLELGYSGDFLDLLSALAPCVLGYGEIGINCQNILIPKYLMYREVDRNIFKYLNTKMSVSMYLVN